LPETFDVFPTFIAHGWIAALLSVLIVLHALGAFWHWLARRDGVMGRMGFGKRRLE
jgi:cytochrome b561